MLRLDNFSDIQTCDNDYVLIFCPVLTYETFIRRCSGSTVASDAVYCIDRHGKLVDDGAVFIPGDDACRRCHCSQGMAAMCTLVHCSTPPCVLWEPVAGECCQFHCIETSLGLPYNPRGSGNGDKNLTIVPIPSMFCFYQPSFLLLFLLFIHEYLDHYLIWNA